MAATEKDQATYALVRMWIETGALHYAHWKKTGSWPESKPSTKELVEGVLGYLPSTSLPLTAEESAQVVQYEAQHPNAEGHLPPTLRRGDVVFRDREALIEGLNENYPDVAATVKASAPDADGWDLELWTVALGVGGALVTLGKVALTWATLTMPYLRLARLAVIAGYLLLGSAAAMGLSAKTPEGKNIIRAGLDAAAAALQEVGKKASMLVTGLIVAGTLALGIGLTVAIVRRSKPRRMTSGRRYVALDAVSVLDSDE